MAYTDDEQKASDERIAKAVRFLRKTEGQCCPVSWKIAFLQTKNLTGAEIACALDEASNGALVKSTPGEG